MKKRSIEELERELEQLRKLVFYDELTCILNRRGFKEETEKVLQTRTSLRRRKTEERRAGFDIPYGIVFIDLDNFKKINDQFGHDVGDEVLKSIAKVFKDRLRANDIYARWGGEEFVVALVGLSFESSKIVAEKIRREIENLKFEIPNLKITASLGVINKNERNDMVEMISSADKAMYEAKKLGKNRVICF